MSRLQLEELSVMDEMTKRELMDTSGAIDYPPHTLLRPLQVAARGIVAGIEAGSVRAATDKVIQELHWDRTRIRNMDPRIGFRNFGTRLRQYLIGR